VNPDPAVKLERVSRSFAGARRPARGRTGLERLGSRGRGVKGLGELSAEVVRGQIAALVGHNGSGKTTALRIVATLVRPSSGRALVFGRDVVTEPAFVRRMIGVSLGAGRSFYWRLSALQNLTFFARLRGLRRAQASDEIARLAAELDVERYLLRSVRGLSRGTLARLSVARALLGDPALLVLDEPFASVDGRSRELMWRALERRARAGRAVILATHDDEVRQMCSPVVELST